jgi:hypothetical protein
MYSFFVNKLAVAHSKTCPVFCRVYNPVMDNHHLWIIRRCRPAVLQWGQMRQGEPHSCRTCGILLLTGERPGFCCGPGGRRFRDVPPLPPLPAEYESFLQEERLSSLSRILNLLFSFASLETTHPFPQMNGPPGFVAIQGKVYHRIRPTHTDSAIRWLLYDGFMENPPHSHLAESIPTAWIEAVHAALNRANPFVHGLHLLSLRLRETPSAELILHDSGAVPEVAACIAIDNTTSQQVKPRQLIVSLRAGHVQQVSAVSRLWEPLSYPLLFPHGTLGWGITDRRGGRIANDDYVDGAGAPTTQIWHYRARLLREPRFEIFGRLTNEYIVDMFSRDLECRLAYIRANQRRLRQEEASLIGINNGEPSQNIYLPASFLGSARWASEQIADALAIAAAFGNPTFFVTVTCNPDWPEIRSRLRPGQNFTDIPVVVVRVFRRKFSMLLQTLKAMFPNVGRPLYIIYSIEFQKRGLPHGHILVKYPVSPFDPDEIDGIVSAEVPPDPNDARLVNQYMTHKHAASNRPPSKYCQREDRDGNRICRFGYPHHCQDRTTIDNEGRIHYRRRDISDQWVVPHCLPLLRQFQCHINFEVSCTSHIFQYLFKYIHKGMASSFFTTHSLLLIIQSMEALIMRDTSFELKTENLLTKLKNTGQQDILQLEKQPGE